MKKLIATLILALATFVSAFAATKAVKINYFDGEGGNPCNNYCQNSGDRCVNGCTISYNGSGQVTSVTCNYGACPDTRPRIVEP